MQWLWPVVVRSFRRHLTYRTAAIAGFVTNLFFGVFNAYVLMAFYDQQQSVNGLSLQAAITYTGLSQAMIVHMAIFGWYDLMRTVYQGEIATDLLKPMNFFGFWLAQDVGRALAGFLLRGLSVMVVYALIFDISYPNSLGQWLALLISFVLAYLLGFGYRFVVNLAAFWSPDARGIGRFAFMTVMLFSGFLMPLRLFPDWARQAMEFTPFPYMVNTVSEVYLGLLTGPALLQALLVQAAWALGLVLLCQWVLARAMHRLVILGG